MVCVLDDLQVYLTTPPGTDVIVLHGPGSICAGRGTSGVSVLFCDDRFTLSRNYGHQRCWRHQGEHYASATVVTRRTFGGGDVTVWAGGSTQNRTALHFVNGTMTSPNHLNNIVNPVVLLLHEQHRLTSSSWTTMLQLIEVTPLGNGCWRLGYLK